MQASPSPLDIKLAQIINFCVMVTKAHGSYLRIQVHVSWPHIITMYRESTFITFTILICNCITSILNKNT